MNPGDGQVAAIEAGGTKVVCAVGRAWEDVRDGEKFVVATTTPERTVASVAAWLRQRCPEGPAAMGVAAFGPLELTTGRVGPTPKPGWAGFDWPAALRGHFPGTVVAVDTDTNGAALAEWRWGAGQDRDVVVYVTVGTGIGGGAVIGGRVLHGLIHPEIGHMRIPHDVEDPFEGICPFHRDCLEGLASGPAVEARWGRPGRLLPPDHPAWDLESRYLAAAVANLALVLSPNMVVMGGGVMAVPGLLASVRARVRDLMGGYMDSAALGEGIDRYIVEPALGPAAGVLGAFALGRDALTRRRPETGPGRPG